VNLVRQETNENIVQNLQVSVTQATSEYGTRNGYSYLDADTETEIAIEETGVHCMRPASHDGVLIEKKEKELSKKQRGNANCNAIATLQEHYELVTSSLHRSNSELYNLKSTCCRKECVRNLKYAIHLWNKNKYVENVFVYKKKSSI
jgi:hypothetical protein